MGKVRVVSTAEDLAAGLEVDEEEEQVADIHTAVLRAGAGPIVEIGRIHTRLELNKEVEQIVDIDAAVGRASAVPTVEVGEASGVLNAKPAGHGEDAPATAIQTDSSIGSDY